MIYYIKIEWDFIVMIKIYLKSGFYLFLPSGGTIGLVQLGGGGKGIRPAGTKDVKYLNLEVYFE